MGIIVSIFDGCGKEGLIEKYHGKAKILDLKSNLPPNEYVDEVMNNLPKNDVVFVPTDEKILDEFETRNIDFDVFYPSEDRRQELVIKLVENKAPFKVISTFDNNFNKWVKTIEDDDSDNCHKHKLNKGEFIYNHDVINEYLEAQVKNNDSNNEE